MRPRRHIEIAEQLISRMKSDSAFTPPPVHEYAARKHVSTLTVWKAYRVLVEKGLLMGSQGRRMRRTDGPSASERTPDDAAEVFAAKIKNSISEGIFRGNERLPKYGTLTAGERVSPATVARALAALSRQGLIYKQGRNWIVGQRPAHLSLSPGVSEAGPVVLLLCTDPHQNVYHNFFMLPFLHTLASELRAKGIILRAGHRILSESGRSPAPNQGMEQVREAIRVWGDLYRGAVIVDQHSDAEIFSQWADFLSCAGSRPVVYFDQNNQNPSYARSELAFGARYFRLYFDEPSAVRLALEALASAGHRIIGIPPIILYTSDAWVKQRLSLLEKAASAMTPRMKIIATPHIEPFWDTGYGNNDPTRAMDLYEAFLRHVAAKEKKPAVRRTPSAEDVLRHTPSLTSLLTQGVTALISLNDWLAHQHYFWCHAAGVKIPDDLSIISFDNDPITQVYPISSVDFGFGGLGYCAARIMCGAEPANVDSMGGIPSTCTLVNHGSVGAPNSGTGRRVRAIVGG